MQGSGVVLPLIAELKEYRADGLSWKEIADVIGVTLDGLRRLRRKYKMRDDGLRCWRNKREGQGSIDAKARELGYEDALSMTLRYRSAGLTCKDVAEKLGCNYAALNYRVRVGRYGLEPTRAQVEARRLNAIKLNQSLAKSGKRFKWR